MCYSKRMGTMLLLIKQLLDKEFLLIFIYLLFIVNAVICFSRCTVCNNVGKGFYVMFTRSLEWINWFCINLNGKFYTGFHQYLITSFILEWINFVNQGTTVHTHTHTHTQAHTHSWCLPVFASIQVMCRYCVHLESSV